MATGRIAFQRETAAQTLASIIESEPVPMARLNPRLPHGLDRVVNRCLSKDPARRYPDTRELARELKSLPPPCAPVPAASRARRPPLRPGRSCVAPSRRDSLPDRFRWQSAHALRSASPEEIPAQSVLGSRDGEARGRRRLDSSARDPPLPRGSSGQRETRRPGPPRRKSWDSPSTSRSTLPSASCGSSPAVRSRSGWDSGPSVSWRRLRPRVPAAISLWRSRKALGEGAKAAPPELLSSGIPRRGGARARPSRKAGRREQGGALERDRRHRGFGCATSPRSGGTSKSRQESTSAIGWRERRRRRRRGSKAPRVNATGASTKNSSTSCASAAGPSTRRSWSWSRSGCGRTWPSTR